MAKKKLEIKRNTPDAVLIQTLGIEGILARFAKAKADANVMDTERDRLRKFIQENMTSGRYGQFVLEISQGTPRVYVSTAGNHYVQHGLIIHPDDPTATLTPGQDVVVCDKDGGILATGKAVDNANLFSEKAPTNCKLTEIPPDVEEE